MVRRYRLLRISTRSTFWIVLMYFCTFCIRRDINASLDVADLCKSERVGASCAADSGIRRFVPRIYAPLRVDAKVRSTQGVRTE
jgi:hypothetical protein